MRTINEIHNKTSLTISLDLPASTYASIKFGASSSLFLDLTGVALPLEQILDFTMFPPYLAAKTILRSFMHVISTQLAIWLTTIVCFPRIINDDVVLSTIYVRVT